MDFLLLSSVLISHNMTFIELYYGDRERQEEESGVVQYGARVSVAAIMDGFNFL